MSLRHRQLKRLRYYRSSVEIQDRFADECGLEICNFTGECNSCEQPRPEARTWALISRGEVTEASEFVCSDCLPAYHARHVAEMNWYGSREFNRLYLHDVREMEANW